MAKCEYYPCHDIANMDCTFCYCPFYTICSSYGHGTKGYALPDGTWACEKCTIIHDEVVARIVEKQLKNIFEETILPDRKKDNKKTGE